MTRPSIMCKRISAIMGEKSRGIDPLGIILRIGANIGSVNS